MKLYKAVIYFLIVVMIATIVAAAVHISLAIAHNKNVTNTDGDTSSVINQDDSFPSDLAGAEDIFFPTISSTTTTTTTTTTNTTTPPTTTPTTRTTTTTTKPVTPPVSSGTRYDCDGTVTVNIESVNLRADAGAGFALVGTAVGGQKFTVTGQKNAPNGVLWFEIDYNGKKAYVCGSFVLYEGKIKGGKAYLTFDDGPSANTAKILDILDKYNVKATFFVIYHRGFDNTYREIVNRGHTIGLHSYSHDYSTIYASKDAFFADLNKIGDHVEKLTGIRPKLMRFPGGSSNTVSKKYCKGIMTELAKEVENQGYTYFDWDVISGDADATTVPAATLIDNIKVRLNNKSSAVILMHDAAKKTTTVEALPTIIEYLQKMGYELLPITENTHPVHGKVAN